MAYLDIEGIKEVFGKHMMKYRGYSEAEAKMAVYDFPDPYRNPYLIEEYDGDETVDGVDYQVYSDYTDLTRCDIDDVPPFRFYTLYRKEDIPNHKVVYIYCNNFCYRQRINLFFDYIGSNHTN